MSKKAIIAKGEEMGLSVSLNYSGRGMFGATCLSVSGSRSELSELIMVLGTKARGYSEDTLGMGVVYYWPAYKGD